MKWKKLAAMFVVFSMVLTGCNVAGQAQVGAGAADQSAEESAQTKDADSQSTADTGAEDGDSVEAATDSASTDETEAMEEVAGPKQVVVYFPNWKLEEEAGTVADIPWEDVTYINHAFWEIAPADGTTETSFERRDNGNPARTEWTVVSTEPEFDKTHFEQYATYSEQYPDVNILLSIGGWTRCGYFSEMAYTPEGRQSFIQSCLDVLDEYPWIDGIDIDWEYPGGSKDGERLPEDEIDQGCPIFGTYVDDNNNYEALLLEMRGALDEHYGEGAKKLTACASASTGWTLPMQKWEKFAPHLDMINIMTYDLAGTWDGKTGHASSFVGAKSAVVYFKLLDIPMDKICIGTPLYGTPLMMKEIPESGNVVGIPIETEKATKDEITETMIHAFEEEAVSGYSVRQEGAKWLMGEPFETEGAGWHYAYDESKGGAYIYNDDENSDYYKWYISYENHLSLQEKMDYIDEMGLAGIIVWECTEDTKDHEFVKQMADNLLE